MKKLFFYLLLTVAIFPSTSSATRHEYICKIAGYYEGIEDRFLHALALRVIEKNRMTDEVSCQSEIKFGNNVAHKYSRLGKVESDEELQLQMHAKHFSALVYDAILSKIKLDW
ncbi:MAG: hypothetical protein M0R33_05650 [Methylomonas sp.]|jgi:hypothetical protein|uniref:hypothetical protein n=1 Tax=Methylomonas sp. TaxID=418 RepID=UPI0025DAB931|nr:hypothetical protein [Methylomonas sp.]MCK9605919.1 hypothetical protein [Methylomonas sp.]